MKSTLTIISLGPGDPDLMNIRTINAIRNAEKLILRTASHPVVSWLEQEKLSYSTLDRFYDSADDFDILNRSIAEYILSLASDASVVYGVQDAVTDCSVRAVVHLAPDPSTIRIIPGISPADRILSAAMPVLGEEPLIVSSASDLISFGYFDPNNSILITELDNQILAGQIKILVSQFLEDDHGIYLIQNNGLPVSISLYQLDRQKRIDHNTSVLIPGSGMLSRNRFVMNDLEALMERLRSPDGCPWDRAQTHTSLRPYIVEEAWECVDAIDQNDPEHLCEELGDLLFQIVFHASISKAFDEFTLGDVVSGVCRKMIRRHPHVFGMDEKKDQNSVSVTWEQIKRDEKGHSSLADSLDDISSGLPALTYITKILKKLGPDEKKRRSSAKIAEQLAVLCCKIGKESDSIKRCELGNLLLLCAELCFSLGADSELILHQTAKHMIDSIKRADKLITDDGKSLGDLTFDELGVYLRHVEGETE